MSPDRHPRATLQPVPEASLWRAWGWWLAGATLTAALAMSGCAPRTAAVVAEPQPLAVPVVPPRVLAPLPEPEPPPEEVAETEAPTAPRRPPRTASRTKPDAPREGAKPETPVEPGATPPTEARPTEPAAPLRTPQTANDQQAERRIREALGRAAKTLSQVNVGNLGGDARQQYDSARRFVDQAEGALKAGNYMFAGYLAEKAEALARGLAGR